MFSPLLLGQLYLVTIREGYSQRKNLCFGLPKFTEDFANLEGGV